MAHPDATQEPEPEGPRTVIVVRSIGPVSDGEPLFCPECGATLTLKMLDNGAVVGICPPCHTYATCPQYAIVKGLDTCPGCVAAWPVKDLRGGGGTVSGEDEVCPYCLQIVEVSSDGRLVKHKSGGRAAFGGRGKNTPSKDRCNGSGVAL